MKTGDWICTYTGVRWFILDPDPNDVRIHDIAHALAHICRFGGHSVKFYSVAQHSVEVATAVIEAYPGDPALHLHALLHDAAEAYVGDVVRPLKRSGFMRDFDALEQMTELAIYTGLQLPRITRQQRAIVKHFDTVLLMTERRDLVNHGGIPWTDCQQPLEATLHAMTSEQAAAEFLKMYDWLKLRVSETEEAA